MVTTLGIVQPPESEAPLKGKVARRLGGKSLLEWVVRRATDCQRLDKVIVAAGAGAEADLVADLVPPDVPLFVGLPKDALARFAAAIDEYPCQAVVRICVETPFMDPVSIDRLVCTAQEHPECDYVGYCLSNGRPTILSAVGIFAEWCRADALRQAHAEARDPRDRRQVTRYLFSHPEKFTVRLTPAPADLDRDDVRLRIDSEEDWDHAQTIFDALGPEALDWQRIAKLLAQQPGLRQRMAQLNRAAAL